MDDNPLGTYLRDRRARLDPATLGLPQARRRTPGLRREEVAARANLSATWYTWLEQGRGGAPSPDVLDRLAHALSLSAAEREHLYLLAQRRPPEAREPAAERISPRLQHVLDGVAFCPAIIKNNIWDVIAWNVAATVLLTDYGAIAPERRNTLRLLFTEPAVRDVFPNWEANARFVVAVFRATTVRANASKRAQKLVSELCALSPEFATMWHDNDVRTEVGGTKHFNHPGGGQIGLDASVFSLEGQPGLTMMVFTPTTLGDVARVAALVAAQAG